MFQIYFYADYVFSQSGIPENKIPYVTLGAGICELVTALSCVSPLDYTFYLVHYYAVKRGKGRERYQ